MQKLEPLVRQELKRVVRRMVERAYKRGWADAHSYHILDATPDVVRWRDRKAKEYTESMLGKEEKGAE